MSEDSDNELDPICNLPAFLVEDQEQQDASTLYKYRDFGQVQEDDDDVAEIPPPTPSSRGSAENSIRVQKFPVKLYAILAQKEFHDIICWLPHGRSWKVLKATMFESLVMPLFFEYSNYHSFNRLVNAWSFRRISSGPDRGSYYHELFLRGKPFLQKYMRRLPKTHKKLPMRKKDEPDFYKLDKSSPLPALEDAPIPGAAATSMAMRQQLQQQIQTQGMPQMTISNNPQSPLNIVTPPHLSPSMINTNGINSGGMNFQDGISGNGSFLDSGTGMGCNDFIGSGMSRNDFMGSGMNRNDILASGMNRSDLLGSGMNRNDLLGTGGALSMGQSGGFGFGNLNSDLMNQGRMNNGLSGNTGPLPPRFNGYVPPGDSYDLQDEYDLQTSLSLELGLGGGSMGLNNYSMNGGGLNGFGNSNGINSIGNDSRYSDLGVQRNFGGLNSELSNNIRRHQQMRRSDMMGMGTATLEGFNRGNGMGGLGGQNDLFSSSFSQPHMGNSHQLQANNGRSHQLQQFQLDASLRASPPISSQLMSNNLSLSQEIYNRGMGNGGNEDFNLRRSLSRA